MSRETEPSPFARPPAKMPTRARRFAIGGPVMVEGLAYWRLADHGDTHEHGDAPHLGRYVVLVRGAYALAMEVRDALNEGPR